MSTVISVEHLSKAYRLGQIGTGTFTYDLQLWWAKLRGNPNPLLRIGEADHGNRDGETIWALKDVCFTVDQGEVLGIIGRNGAGKSTLLKILSRVTAPTSGKIKVKGRVASLLEVGTGFHPELTGRENIYLNGSILGMNRKEIDRKFDEIVDFAGVEKFIETPVKRYSSGMYVRLAFAVAAHLEPEILVVDEVLAVGDAEFQRKCLGRMGEVAREGRTVLFVSHNMGAIRNLCPSVILLDNGKVDCQGITENGIRRYLSKLSANIGTDLAERLDRKGDGRVRIQKLRIMDKNGHTQSSVQTGQEIRIELAYRSRNEEKLRNVLFEVKATDQQGLLLFTLSTLLTGENFETLPQEGNVFCHLDQLPLTPDVINLSVICYVNNVLSDWVLDAHQIRVMDGDYLGSGRNIDKRVYGSFVVPHHWYLEK